MNKFFKFLLAVLAGLEVVFYLLSPMVVVILWNDYSNYPSVLLYVVGIGATIYRGIKIGFLKE